MTDGISAPAAGLLRVKIPIWRHWRNDLGMSALIVGGGM